ncbi:SET domain-containing protein-lysine N-methyltransferase [Mesorhizobium sp. M2A.F.Ca.ET.037.01.1.1]|uniref:SET domain-containing protein-lysine N-methyltransferase n=1 Tax=Mesorhizobium sp. M2A.F.Ca.ET.037.01.1.1 TaxID=2496748 RepID=UPI000FCB452C|nr:SET domain-containing protein-lysine N-methyltransferase [Mesorhizobium sp. M2A.F.Ca.ET.037.01.1.1]RUX22374.1 SET domain-containing protein-lysine N-methyltransferase [Mesorhizobium sp. M2A.F.Ca.ET.037.01.1.1]
MSDTHINQDLSILTDDVACAKQLNARNVKILSTGGERGRGVFAARDFLPGEIVVIGLIDRMETVRTTNSFQLDWNVHALFHKPAVIVNHCCDPNLAIVPNRFGAYDFVAIQHISSGAEVTWNYATSEFECIGYRYVFVRLEIAEAQPEASPHCLAIILCSYRVFTHRTSRKPKAPSKREIGLLSPRERNMRRMTCSLAVPP